MCARQPEKAIVKTNSYNESEERSYELSYQARSMRLAGKPVLVAGNATRQESPRLLELDAFTST